MNELVANVLMFLGASTGLTALLMYLGKALINKMFAKDLEKFKADLQIEAYKKNFTFEKLHIERASVIKELIKKLRVTYKEYWEYLNWIQPRYLSTKEEKKQKALDVVSDAFYFYYSNRVYFSDPVLSICNNLFDTLQDSWNKFHLPLKSQTEISDQDVYNNNEKIPKIIEQLED